ncbi:MAG TPA: NAD(P)/FAD-dependent oxidoreductase, partial [Nitrososphaera sp.]
LFVKNMHDLNAYRQEVLERFRMYALVFKFIQLKIAGKFSMAKHGFDMLKIYRHMKSEEARYGMEVRMADMLKVSRV